MHTSEFSRIRTHRDVLLLRSARSRVLVVACDSLGAIGPKALDILTAGGGVVGRFTARVALMEAMSVGARPFCIVSTMSVEPYPTGSQIIKGIRSELRRAKLNVPIMLSTEKNMQVRQTGLGVTVLATVSKRELRVGKSRPGDLVIAIGLAHVGSEVMQGEKNCRIADLKDLLRLSSSTFVHEIIPVGSVGILREAKVIAADSDLKFRSTSPSGFDLGKSAGPATVLLCSVSPSEYEDLSSLTKKPLTKIGVLE